jgi:3-hydroxyisobutyrate dehydrogenase-like beta-hydroxyacid dehydrogenase
MPVNGGKNSEALAKFGRFMVENFRDRALDSYVMVRNGRAAAPALQKLKADFATWSPDVRAAVDDIVLHVVDSALHDVLRGFQEAHDLNQGIQVTVDGSVVAAESGMLHGEMFGDDGWVAQFSRHATFPPSGR